MGLFRLYFQLPPRDSSVFAIILIAGRDKGFGRVINSPSPRHANGLYHARGTLVSVIRDYKLTVHKIKVLTVAFYEVLR